MTELMQQILENREHHFDTWEELEGFVNGELMPWWEDLDDYKEIPPLFRGQADSKWKLESTLDREPHEREMYIEKYHNLLKKIRPSIEKEFPETIWTISDTLPDEIRDLFPRDDYEFMVYLRHHGFPSPLLEWSKLLDVAAYMAFRETSSNPTAIWVNILHPGNGCHKVICPGNKLDNAHPRHKKQQAYYTTSFNRDFKNRLYYQSHHSFFIDKEREIDSGPLILKLTLPTTERIKVLRKLRDKGITEHTLMRSEDNLMKSLSMDHFLLKSKIAKQVIKKTLAPCGLNCKKCVENQNGQIQQLADGLEKSLGNLDRYAERFTSEEPAFSQYPQFKDLLEHMAAANCEGCRSGSCKLNPGCGVMKCHHEKQVDFCFECADFPCDHTNFDPDLKRRWLEMNSRMKEIGIEAYYAESMDRPRYT